MVAQLRGGLNSPPIEFTAPPPPVADPLYGPYATADGKVSAEGSQILLGFLAKYPHPGKIIRWRWPALYHYAAERYDEEGIDTACTEGAVDAVLRYRPGVAQFGTCAAFRMRQTLLRELGLTGHDRDGKRPKLVALKAGPVSRDSGDVDRIDRDDQSRLFRSRILASVKAHVGCAKKRKIVALRHGLRDGQHRELQEVGGIVGLSKARVQQVNAEVLSKIRPDLKSLWMQL